MLCSRCGSHVAPGSKFCGDCGRSLAWQCHACGYPNPSAGRFCLECGHLAANDFCQTGPTRPNPTPQLERRQLSAMFVDLVGSTSLGAKLDAEDLREVIFAHHNSVTSSVTGQGGHVARYIGDGVLVYFGYPAAREDDAERAVRAALTVVEAISRLGTAACPAGSLSSRVGIATGSVVVGAIVDNDQSPQTAIGQTLNLAARLQAVAEPGMVVIDGATRRLTGAMFEYRQLGPLSLKGLDVPITAWAVLKENAVESRFEALRSSQSPLIGRTEEIALLHRRWEQVATGHGRVVLLSGEPGVGKSRLISALEASVQERAPGRRLRFSCSEYHKAITRQH